MNDKTNITIYSKVYFYNCFLKIKYILREIKAEYVLISVIQI